MTTPVGHDLDTPATPAAPAAAPAPTAADPAPAPAAPVAAARPARTATLASVVNSSAVRLALLGVLAILGGILVVRPSTPAGGDYSGLATDLAAALNKQTGVSQTTGGYLPGTGVLLVSSVSGVTSDQLTATLAAAVSPAADRVKALPAAEAVSWQANLSGSSGAATSWLIRVAPANAATPAKWVLAPVTGTSGTGAAAAAPDTASAAGSSSAAPATASAAPATASGAATATGSSSAPAAAATTAAATGGSATSGTAATSVAAEGSAAGAAMTNGAFKDDFAKDSGQWSPLTGSWALSGGGYRQTDASGYDFITQLQPTPGKTFTVSVRMRGLSSTANAGLLLGQPNLGTRNGADLIDLSGKDYVRWGQYDSSSGTYRFIGGASLGATQDPTKWHTMSVTVTASATTVSWDGKQIGSFGAIAAGHLGLVTSQSAVEFDDFVVHA